VITTNSLGKRIAKTDEQIAAFWRWFGDSKVVDEQGRPLVVYHGTGIAMKKFEREASGAGAGAWFTPDLATAKEYAEMDASVDGTKPLVVRAYLSLQNPWLTSDADAFQNNSAAQRDALEEKGHDGIVGSYTGGGWKDREYIAFHPTQIKAVNNRGTFDPNDPVITNPGTLVNNQDEHDHASPVAGEKLKGLEEAWVAPDGDIYFVRKADVDLKRGMPGKHLSHDDWATFFQDDASEEELERQGWVKIKWGRVHVPARMTAAQREALEEWALWNKTTLDERTNPMRKTYDFSHGRRNPYAKLLPAASGPFNRRELAVGVQVEREHTRDRATARRIATHHLAECPRYYTLLRAMEKACAKNPGEVIQAGPGPFVENAVLRKLQQTMYEATGTWATLEEIRPVALRAFHAAAAKQKQAQFRVMEGGRKANPDSIWYNGSPRQIEWAKSIRARKLPEIQAERPHFERLLQESHELLKDFERPGYDRRSILRDMDSRKACVYFIAWAHIKNDAKFWIDNRDKPARSLVLAQGAIPARNPPGAHGRGVVLFHGSRRKIDSVKPGKALFLTDSVVIAKHYAGIDAVWTRDGLKTAPGQDETRVVITPLEVNTDGLVEFSSGNDVQRWLRRNGHHDLADTDPSLFDRSSSRSYTWVEWGPVTKALYDAGVFIVKVKDDEINVDGSSTPYKYESWAITGPEALVKGRNPLPKKNPPDEPAAAPARITGLRPGRDKVFRLLTDVGRVYLVDGNAVRTQFPEFIGGGHPAVYRFVPKGEIWLEKRLEDEAAYLFAHEAIEVLLMHWLRLNYKRAHDLANRLEGDLRLAIERTATSPQFAGLRPNVRVERVAASLFLQHMSHHFPNGETVQQLRLANGLAGSFRRLL